MKKPDKFYLTADTSKAMVTLVMRANKPVGLPPEALGYARCLDCKQDVVYNKMNKKAAKMAKICNECFERVSGMTVLELIATDPKEAEKALKKVFRDVEKARRLYA
jgi:hypothetical protein